MAGVELIPAAVEVLGDQAELDDQDARQVERSLLSALFSPEPQQGLLVLAHDDSGIGAAYEVHTFWFMRGFGHLGTLT
jgi:hypothetical protein